MVKGLDKFKDYFAGYEGNYVIIGGTACNIYEEMMAQEPRATKDIDLILIVEALTDSFVKRFWEFVVAGQYQQRERGEGEHMDKSGRKHEFFRFIKPADSSFPKQIELFSRNLGLIGFPADAHITPIPVRKELSSLSAILLDDDYYNFTISNSELVDGVHYANPYSLICLKAKAYLDMTRRKAEGEDEDSYDIEKHKKDVFRMAALLDSVQQVELPSKLLQDMKDFVQIVSDDLPGKELFKAMKTPALKAESLLESIREIFLST
ncbi:MAG: hypothetical protein IK045_00100 [Bacteroidales bacterium]|nr:hypothetical protein [Bacteroidales bacterium]